MANERDLSAKLQFKVDRSSASAAKRAVEDIEDSVDDIGDAAEDSGSKFDDFVSGLGESLFALFAIDSVITSITDTITKFVEFGGRADDVSRAWLDTSQRIELSQIRIGKVIAKGLLPALERVAQVTEDISFELETQRPAWEFFTVAAFNIGEFLKLPGLPEKFAVETAGLFGKDLEDFEETLKRETKLRQESASFGGLGDLVGEEPLQAFIELERFTEDFERERLQIITTFEGLIVEETQNQNEARAKLVIDFFGSQLEAEKEQNEEQAKIARDFGEETEQLEREHRKNLKRIDEDFNNRIGDAAAARDAISALRAIRERNQARNRAQEDFSDEAKQSNADFAKEMATSQKEFEETQAARKANFEDTLTELQKAQETQLSALKSAKDNELRLLDDAFAREKAIQEQAFKDLLASLGLIQDTWSKTLFAETKKRLESFIAELVPLGEKAFTTVPDEAFEAIGIPEVPATQIPEDFFTPTVPSVSEILGIPEVATTTQIPALPQTTTTTQIPTEFFETFSLPEVEIPEIIVPEIIVSEVILPDTQVSEIQLPEVILPDIQLPEIQVPKEVFISPFAVDANLPQALGPRREDTTISATVVQNFSFASSLTEAERQHFKDQARLQAELALETFVTEIMR